MPVPQQLPSVRRCTVEHAASVQSLALELHVPGANATTSRWAVPHGATLARVSGTVSGEVLTSVQFHASDGASSPVYGLPGAADAPFAVAADAAADMDFGGVPRFPWRAADASAAAEDADPEEKSAVAAGAATAEGSASGTEIENGGGVPKFPWMGPTSTSASSKAAALDPAQAAPAAAVAAAASALHTDAKAGGGVPQFPWFRAANTSASSEDSGSEQMHAVAAGEVASHGAPGTDGKAGGGVPQFPWMRAADVSAASENAGSEDKKDVAAGTTAADRNAPSTVMKTGDGMPHFPWMASMSASSGGSEAGPERVVADGAPDAPKFPWISGDGNGKGSSAASAPHGALSVTADGAKPNFPWMSGSQVSEAGSIAQSASVASPGTVSGGTDAPKFPWMTSAATADNAGTDDSAEPLDSAAPALITGETGANGGETVSAARGASLGMGTDDETPTYPWMPGSHGSNESNIAEPASAGPTDEAAATAEAPELPQVAGMSAGAGTSPGTDGSGSHAQGDAEPRRKPRLPWMIGYHRALPQAAAAPASGKDAPKFPWMAGATPSAPSSGTAPAPAPASALNTGVPDAAQTAASVAAGSPKSARGARYPWMQGFDGETTTLPAAARGPDDDAPKFPWMTSAQPTATSSGTAPASETGGGGGGTPPSTTGALDTTPGAPPADAGTQSFAQSARFPWMDSGYVEQAGSDEQVAVSSPVGERAAAAGTGGPSRARKYAWMAGSRGGGDESTDAGSAPGPSAPVRESVPAQTRVPQQGFGNVPSEHGRTGALFPWMRAAA